MIEKHFEDEKAFYKQAQSNIIIVMPAKKTPLWHAGPYQLYLKLYSLYIMMLRCHCLKFYIIKGY